MQQLSALISKRESWLVDRILHYAKLYGYAPLTPTLTEAWRVSIRGLSESLIEALTHCTEPPQLLASDGDYAKDPITDFGIKAARSHRSRGITLGQFLGLMKYYRQSYLDLLESDGLAAENLLRCRDFINRFFDRVEIGFCSEWASEGESVRVQRAYQQNRSMSHDKNKYLTIFESLKHPVVLLDASGRVDNANHAANALFGGSTVPGAGYYSPVHLPLLHGSLEALAGNDGEHLLMTVRGPRSFEVKSQVMLDVSEKFAGTVLIFDDISEYKRALEQAKQADRTKSAFLAAMSHEIRTPITGIIGKAALLCDTQLDERQRRYVNVISTSSEILSSLVTNILDYSKIESGELELETISFSVDKLVGDVLTLMQPAAESKGLHLSADLDPSLSASVEGDFARLRQILINLVGNAIKFTARGGVQVRIVTVGKYLHFSVHDSGIGIPENVQPHLFSAFVQADASISRRFGGTGLGLAICRELVTAMGGEIGLESQLGVGSTFWFQVPLVYTPIAVERPDDALAAETRALGVLVVEDEEVNRRVACGLLSKAGHRVAAVVSGEEALEILRHRRFDLVLMDLHLPGIDGIETIRRIRASQRPASGLPIVVLSASVTKDDVRSSMAAGADGFLGKPYRLPNLLATMRAAIQHRYGPGDQPDALRWADGPAPNSEMEVDEGLLAQHAEQLGLSTTEHIIGLFISSAQISLAQARTGLRQGSMQNVVTATHRLKGSASTLGLWHLAGLAGAIEMMATKSIEAGLEQSLDELAHTLPATIVALRTAWKKVQSPATT